MTEQALRLGVVELGVLLATFLYGIATLQAFFYMERSSGDSRSTRMLAAVIWIGETIHTICIWALFYSWSITNFGIPDGLDKVTWSLAASLVLSPVLGSLVQSFFAYRIYIFSKTLFFPLLIWFGAVVRLALGIFRVVVLVHSVTLPIFINKYKWLLTSTMSLNALIDFLNTFALCFCLLRNRPMHTGTRRMLYKLLLYTIEIGSVTCACSVAITITVNIRPHNNLIYLALLIIYPKLFSNSFYTTLNTRQKLRNMVRSSEDSRGQGIPDIHITSRRHDLDVIDVEMSHQGEGMWGSLVSETGSGRTPPPVGTSSEREREPKPEPEMEMEMEPWSLRSESAAVYR